MFSTINIAILIYFFPKIPSWGQILRLARLPAPMNIAPLIIGEIGLWYKYI
jgi:hypothetical protein